MTRVNQERDLVVRSSLVDSAWYRGMYRDVERAGVDPVDHYLRYGWRLGRDPGPAFSAREYLSLYPDVAEAGVNPLVHYLTQGSLERRLAVPGGDQRSKMPHIMICAHQVGASLFGGERSLLDILKAVRSLGYRTLTTIPRNKNPEYVRMLQQLSDQVLTLRYDWWRQGRALDERAVTAFAEVIRAHGIDLVHVNTIMLREPLAAARRSGVASVVHVRELVDADPDLCRVIGEPPEVIISKVQESADYVVANSRTTADVYDKRRRPFVVRNGIDYPSFAHVEPKRSGPFSVGLISSNLPKKGIADFFAVAERVATEAPEILFKLIGPMTNHVRELQADVAQRGAALNLEYVDYVSNPVEALAHLDVTVNLSHFRESFGRTVLEAMAAATPVVAYDWGALGELVQDGITGYLVPFKDTNAVAERILRLHADPTRAHHMGAEGRKNASERLTLRNTAEALGHAYTTILADHRAGPREDSAEPPQEATGPEVLPARTPPCERESPRIAYVLWHFPVPSETFVLNELRILVEQGLDVRVFCRQSPHQDFRPDFPIQWQRVSGPEELAEALRATRRTVVHSHFVYPTVTELVWPACESAGVPFTFIAHAQDIFRHENDRRNRIGELSRSALCLRVLVPSTFHRRYLLERGVPDAKICLNPNGIDASLYDPAWTTRTHRRRTRSVCAVHRFTEKKGLGHLIRAGRLLAEEGISIHLYGYGPLQESFEAEIARAGLTNVVVNGPIEGREALLDAFASHELFLCPSVRAADGDMDGIPTVLMEAMAAGLPVLATHISGIPDLVIDGVSGLVCEPTAESIAAAVARFFSMADDEVSAITAAARGRVLDQFDVVTTTEALTRIWQDRALDVVVVSYNHLPELQEVIRRLFAFTRLPFHLVVFDNDSEAGVKAYLRELHASADNVTVVLNDSNLMVGPGLNRALARGSSDYAVYLCAKEGFLLRTGWERPVLRYMDQHPRVGIAGSIGHSPHYLHGADYPEEVPLFAAFRSKDFASAHPSRLFGHVQGGLFVLRRAMFEQIGGFSEEVPHLYNDVEYSFFAESSGWELGSIPGIASVYEKSRPGLLARVDEQTFAAHPPSLSDLALFGRITSADVACCPICEWVGDRFDGVDGSVSDACPQCAASGMDRTLFRFLANSTLLHRRLPALAVNLTGTMRDYWRGQFQGLAVSGAALRAAGAEQPLALRDGGLKVVYLRTEASDNTGMRVATAEARRLVAEDGVVILHGHAHDLDQDVHAGSLVSALTARGFAHERYQFRSAVRRDDARPMLVLARGAHHLNDEVPG